MKKTLRVIVGALLAATAAQTLAVPTESTPVPNAILTVEQTLESQTRQLGDNLEQNADRLEQAADQLANCDAELAPQNPSPDDSARYLECRQDALAIIQQVQEKNAADFKAFAQGIEPVSQQVEAAIAGNAKTLERYQLIKRKTEVAKEKTLKRAHKVANALPTDGSAPSRELRNEMRRLYRELRYIEHKAMLVDATIKGLQANAADLTTLKGNVLDWSDEARGIADDFALDARITGDVIEAGAVLGEDRILIDQFNNADIGRISQMISRMQGIDYDELVRHGILPEDRDPEDPISFGGSDKDVIQFFMQMRTHP